jgi:hypothetical protein
VDQTAADEPILATRGATWCENESCARRVLLCGQARESFELIGVGRPGKREFEDLVSTIAADVTESVECLGIVFGDQTDPEGQCCTHSEGRERPLFTKQFIFALSFGSSWFEKLDEQFFQVSSICVANRIIFARWDSPSVAFCKSSACFSKRVADRSYAGPKGPSGMHRAAICLGANLYVKRSKRCGSRADNSLTFAYVHQSQPAAFTPEAKTTRRWVRWRRNYGSG